MSINKNAAILDEVKTVHIDLGEYGDVDLRTSLDGAVYEALVNYVSGQVFDGVDYYPSRKEPMMTLAFIQAFVVDEKDQAALTPLEGDNQEADLYAAHQLVVDKLNLLNKAVSESKEIRSLMMRLDSEVDRKVDYLISRSNAEFSSGAATSVAQTLDEINAILPPVKEFVLMSKDVLKKNKGKLSAMFSKKNMEGFVAMMDRKIDEAIQAGLPNMTGNQK